MTDDLVHTVVSHGVTLVRHYPTLNHWQGLCPFGDHPFMVDLHAGTRQMAFEPGSVLRTAWRLVAPAWRPAFNVRPATGTFHCFGCGAAGGRDEFVRLIEENR